MMALVPSFFFFFNDTATTEIYTLSLHDALPIYGAGAGAVQRLLDGEHLGVVRRPLDEVHDAPERFVGQVHQHIMRPDHVEHVLALRERRGHPGPPRPRPPHGPAPPPRPRPHPRPGEWA